MRLRTARNVLIGALTLATGAARAQQVARPQIRFVLSIDDARRICVRMPNLWLRKSTSQHIRLHSFRDVRVVGGRQIELTFDTKYENFQRVPLVRMQRKRVAMFGKTVKFDLPVPYMERRRVLSVTQPVTVRLSASGDQLRFEVVDFDACLPAALRERIVREINKRIRSVLSELPRLSQRYGVSLDVHVDGRAGSASRIEADAGALERLLGSLLRRGRLARYGLVPAGARVRVRGAEAIAGVLGIGGKVAAREAWMTRPRITLQGGIVELSTRLSCRGLEVRNEPRGDGELVLRLRCKPAVEAGKLRLLPVTDLENSVVPGRGDARYREAAHWLRSRCARNVARALTSLSVRVERLQRTLELDIAGERIALGWRIAGLRIADGRAAVEWALLPRAEATTRPRR